MYTDSRLQHEGSDNLALLTESELAAVAMAAA